MMDDVQYRYRGTYIPTTCIERVTWEHLFNTTAIIIIIIMRLCAVRDTRYLHLHFTEKGKKKRKENKRKRG